MALNINPLKSGTATYGLRLMSAVLLTAFGVALVIVAFFMPPAGKIDPSVLTAYGETLTFAGALFGIDCRYRERNISNSKNQEQ